MNRFFVNVLILGCIVGIVFAMPASAQVSYFLKWDGLIALWHAMFKNDPTDGGWPIQEGSTLNIGVSLYRQIGNQSYRVIPEDEECNSQDISPISWSVSGPKIILYPTCPNRTDISLLWNNAGSYTVSASLSGYAAVTKNPAALKFAYWRPEALTFEKEYVEPDTSQEVYVSVVPSTTNFQNVDCPPLTLHIAGIDNTGGHVHNHSVNGNPCGTGKILWGSTPGIALGSYKASEVSQKESIYAAANLPFNVTPSETIDVKYEGLLNLADLDVFSGFIWELVGQTSDHPDNHYVSVEAGYGLSWAIVQYYAELGSGQNLVHINDCSLEWGGLFDIEADWASPHSSHRKGDQTDLRYSNLTAAERTVLEEKILNMGGQILIHGVGSNKHYHVDWSGR